VIRYSTFEGVGIPDGSLSQIDYAKGLARFLSRADDMKMLNETIRVEVLKNLLGWISAYLKNKTVHTGKWLNKCFAK